MQWIMVLPNVGAWDENEQKFKDPSNEWVTVYSDKDKANTTLRDGCEWVEYWM